MMQSDALAKIEDAELRSAARSGTSALETVVIELELPETKLSVSRDPRSGRRTLGFLTSESSDQAEAAIARTLADWIAKVLQSRDFHYLSAARAFVADVPLDRLEELASSPLIRAIRANRRRVS